MTSMPKQLPAPAKRSPLGWWLDELGSLLPKSGRRSDQMARACLLRLEGEALRIVELRRGAEQELGRVLLPGEGIDTTVDPDLVKQVRSRSGRVRLVLRPNDGLAVSDRLPAGAEGDAALIMRHKIDILTPWSAEDVLYDVFVAGKLPDGRVEAVLAVAPRSVVDDVTGRLQGLGIVPDAVDLIGPDGVKPLGADLLHFVRPPSGPGFVPKAVLGIVAVGLLANGVIVGQQVWARQTHIEAQTERASALEQRFAEIPQMQEQLADLEREASFISAERHRVPSAVVVLEVLSRLLPDTVWLSDLQLDGTKLTINGYADAAAPLVPLIEASPHFKNVQFEAASTRVRADAAGGREVERFSITATVEPLAEPGP
ncbi:MAG: PilN domain-containing protein [Geminicoccaceae bacterium]